MFPNAPISPWIQTVHGLTYRVNPVLGSHPADDLPPRKPSMKRDESTADKPDQDVLAPSHTTLIDQRG